MNNLKKNGALYLLEKISNIIFTLMVMILISRTYGPENIGKLAYINSISGILIILPTLGFDHFVVRDLVEKKEEGELFGTVFLCQIVGWLAYTAILYLLVWFSDSTATGIYLASMVALTTIFTRLASIRLYFEAEQNPKLITKVVIGVRLIELLFVIVLINIKAKYIFSASNILLQAFLLSVFLLIAYQKNGVGIQNWRFSYGRANELVAESWPFIISGLIFPIYLNIDMVMIKYFMDDYSVGIYSVAMKIITQVSFFGTVFSALLFPVIIKIKLHQPERYRCAVLSSVSLVLMISVLGVLFSILISKHLIPLLFGAEYTPSIAVFNILSMVWLFLWPASIFTRLLVIENATKVEMVKTFMAALANIALNLLLIPKYGLEGAAIASITAYFISDLLMYGLFKQTRWFFNTWWKSFLMIFLFWRIVKSIKRLEHDINV